MAPVWTSAEAWELLLEGVLAWARMWWGWTWGSEIR